jgi:asparagine synthase (glutamine-hydrolysing)
MSGLAAMYNLDGRPAEQQLFARMLTAIAHRGPDGLTEWIDGPVGLGHAMLATTLEARHEREPLLDDAAGIHLTFDGRVDNRQELSKTLAGKGFRLRDDTDAELVLRAYECWGENSPQKIIGDFAYVIWDSRRSQLFCARDVLGVKPFYYFTDGRVFLAGSELHQILAYPGVPCKPNDGMIAEYLAVNITRRDETLYRDILRLAPGCCLVVRSEGTRSRSYYDLCTAPELHYSTNEQYADHFREIFQEAVRCRLRGGGPVIAHLSGGLDSSSVVGMAQHLIQNGSVTVPRFETTALVFAEPESDEHEYIAQMEAMWGLKFLPVQPSQLDLTSCLTQTRRYRDIPDYPNSAMADSLRQTALDEGFRVCLTGMGADEWLTGCNERFADYLRKFRFSALTRDLRAGSPVLDNGRPTPSVSSLQTLLQWGVWPLVAPHLGARGCRAVRKLIGHETLPPFLKRDLGGRVGIQDRLSREPVRRVFPTFSQQAVYQRFAGGEETHRFEITERGASWIGLDERHPFLDRRLIEYAYVLPASQQIEPPFTKFVLRNAVTGLVPDSIRLRRSKADFSHMFVKAVERLGGQQLFNSPMCASMGWIDAAEARRACTTLIDGYRTGNRKYNVYMWPLWRTVAIELWLRMAFDQPVPQAAIASDESDAPGFAYQG